MVSLRSPTKFRIKIRLLWSLLLILAGAEGLGFAIAKPSVPPRSKYREQAPDICSLRRPVEPTVLILPTKIRIKIRLLWSLLLILAGTSGRNTKPRKIRRRHEKCPVYCLWTRNYRGVDNNTRQGIDEIMADLWPIFVDFGESRKLPILRQKFTLEPFSCALVCKDGVYVKY